MAKARAQSLTDLAGLSSSILIRCRSCGREVEYDAAMIVRYFHARGWSTLFAHAGRRFRCEGSFGYSDGCGARDPEFRAKPPPPMPPRPPAPIRTDRTIQEEIRHRRG